jgi:hypothetical protein
MLPATAVSPATRHSDVEHGRRLALLFRLHAGVCADSHETCAADDKHERRSRLLLLDETSRLRPLDRGANRYRVGRRPAVMTRRPARSRRAIALVGAGLRALSRVPRCDSDAARAFSDRARTSCLCTGCNGSGRVGLPLVVLGRRAHVDHGHARNAGNSRSGKPENPARRRGAETSLGQISAARPTRCRPDR